MSTTGDLDALRELRAATPLGRQLDAVAVEAVSDDTVVTARVTGDRVVVTVAQAALERLEQLGPAAVEPALGQACSRVLAARGEARATTIHRALDPDPLPRTARDLEASRRLGELTVEASSAAGEVTVRVVGGRHVTVTVAEHGASDRLGPAVSEALAAALARHRVAAYRMRCEVFSPGA